MKNLCIAIASFLASLLESQCIQIGDAIKAHDIPGVLVHTGLLLLEIAGLCVATWGLCALVCTYWEFLTFPVGLLLLIWYAATRTPKMAPVAESPVKESVEEVRARAEKAYPLMKQTAYLLFTDLCCYLSGLVAPFSLAAVTVPVNFDITPSLATKFHFVIAKGQCDAPTVTVKEILDNLIFQHLQAQDLPISIPAIYTAADGSTWPGLVVDGVYDLGNQYRVDLVITNEAEVAALKAKGLSWSDNDTDTIPKDPDFD